LTTFAELCDVIGCFVIISHIWGFRWNLGYFAWGCKCSSGLFWKAWPCASRKPPAAIPPDRVCPYIQHFVYQLSPSGTRIRFSGFVNVIRGAHLPIC